MRLKTWVPLLLALSTTAVAQDKKNAQDGLTPTDVLDTLRFTAGARLSASLGQGTLEVGPASEDADLREFLVTFHAAVGLGFGFEVEAALPVAFMAELEVNGSGFELRDEAKGLGDLVVGVNYALLKDNGSDPQLIVGAFVVLPTGDDDPGELETIVGGVVTNAGEEGGIGNGAFSFGFQVGLSKRFGSVEPYFVFRYFLGGDSDVDDIETDHADVGTLLLGIELHAGDELTIDLRANINFNSDEVEEDITGAESTEEAHVSYGFEGRLYASLGSQVAFVAGLGIAAVEDHAISKESNFDLTDTFVFGAEIGIQISFGK